LLPKIRAHYTYVWENRTNCLAITFLGLIDQLDVDSDGFGALNSRLVAALESLSTLHGLRFGKSSITDKENENEKR
jgi:hypothetical protein